MSNKPTVMMKLKQQKSKEKFQELCSVELFRPKTSYWKENTTNCFNAMPLKYGKKSSKFAPE
jgi:hypothetical protein